jgi:hypothetical protein
VCLILNCLKGKSNEIFYLWFFRQTIPLGPLILGLKRVRIKIRIRGDIRPRKSTPRYASLRGVTYICEFLCEFGTICKNDLTHSSVTEVGLIDEKNRGPKISWNCPFNTQKILLLCEQNQCRNMLMWLRKGKTMRFRFFRHIGKNPSNNLQLQHEHDTAPAQ